MVTRELIAQRFNIHLTPDAWRFVQMNIGGAAFENDLKDGAPLDLKKIVETAMQMYREIYEREPEEEKEEEPKPDTVPSLAPAGEGEAKEEEKEKEEEQEQEKEKEKEKEKEQDDDDDDRSPEEQAIAMKLFVEVLRNKDLDDTT